MIIMIKNIMSQDNAINAQKKRFIMVLSVSYVIMMNALNVIKKT